MRMDASEIDVISGALKILSDENDHAVIDRFCGVASAMHSRGARVIAFMSGTSATLRHDTAHTVLARSDGYHSYHASSLRIAALEIASTIGQCFSRRRANDHSKFPISCGNASRMVAAWHSELGKVRLSKL